jgi:hypothetical protein
MAHSEDTKRKISLANSGKKRSPLAQKHQTALKLVYDVDKRCSREIETRMDSIRRWHTLAGGFCAMTAHSLNQRDWPFVMVFVSAIAAIGAWTILHHHKKIWELKRELEEHTLWVVVDSSEPFSIQKLQEKAKQAPLN